MDEYLDRVLAYLEYLNYPDFIQEFHAEDLSRCMMFTIGLCYKTGQSHHMAALLVFSFTLKRLTQLSMQEVRH